MCCGCHTHLLVCTHFKIAPSATEAFKPNNSALHGVVYCQRDLVKTRQYSVVTSNNEQTQWLLWWYGLFGGATGPWGRLRSRHNFLKVDTLS